MIQVAVIGCGAVVLELYRAALVKLERLGYLRIACLVDTHADRLERLHGVFPRAGCYRDADQAYRKAKVDLTLITSPPAAHAKAASIAISHGSHVLCEKPLASSLDEAESMVGEAHRAGVLLAVGLTRRFCPTLSKARQLVESDALGGPLQFAAREGKVYNWPVASDAPFRRGSGGGVLLDIGSHVMDTLCWLFGRPAIHSCQDDALSGGVEANCIVEMSFPNARGTMQLSWDQPLASGLTIVGPKAALRVPAGELHQFQVRAPDGAWENRLSDTQYHDDLLLPARRFRSPDVFSDCIYLQLIQLLRAIHHSEPVPVSGDAALVSMCALEECREIATPLTQDWLPAVERDALRAAHWRAPWRKTAPADAPTTSKRTSASVAGAPSFQT